MTEVSRDQIAETDNSHILAPSTSNEVFSENITSIKHFYKNAEIFVTGATGFLGKVLIEKLLRSCNDLKHIYVLLRSKRGLPIQQRYNDFIKSQIFDRIRQSNPDHLDKIICIAGDITQPALILDDYYKENLLNNVNIVFHVAATIKFDESLHDAAALNTIGTQRILDLCCQMKQIKSFVHVSTAYCNPNRSHIDEIVYPTDPIDRNTFTTCLNIFPGDDINLIADRIQGKHPNTYTLTKSMAESIVADYNIKFPVCIVRPSIVTAAVNEPFPGWVDNMAGATGLLIQFGLGMITSMICDKNKVADSIPVDIVVKTLIAAAWENAHQGNFINSSNNIQVYNCTSGELNPIKWIKFCQLNIKHSRKYPSKYTMLYPGTKFRTNRLVHKFYEIFYHYLPALLFDLVSRLKGRVPIMIKIARKFKKVTDDNIYFTTREWKFENKNLFRLIDKVNMVEDSDEFVCSFTWDWDSYMENYVLGIRQYLLKDDLNSLESARLKIKRLLWIKRSFQFSLFIAILSFIVHPLFN